MLALEHLDGQLKVIRYLETQSAASDQIFVWGTAPLIYFQSGRECPSRFVSNLGLISSWAPRAWRAELVRDLSKKKPRFIIVERRDAIPSVSGTSLDSEQSLARYPALLKILRSQYQRARSFKDFVIYSQREPSS